MKIDYISWKIWVCDDQWNPEKGVFMKDEIIASNLQKKQKKLKTLGLSHTMDNCGFVKMQILLY